MIKGFERYSVSDLGRVRNNATDRLLKPRISNHGTNKHAKVTLSVDGRAHQKFVHRLVAAAFIRELTKDDIVNHRNGIQTDNRISNLEICDLSENGRHSFALRGKMSRFNAAFIPVANSVFKGLFISSSNKRQDDDDLFEYFRSKGFQCIRCEDRRRFKALIETYLNS